MTGALTIRPATLADYAGLCALFAELDAYHRAHRPDMFRAAEGPARSEARVAELIAGPGSTLLVACDGDLLVGLATVIERPLSSNPLHHPRRIVEIDNIVVREDRRGSGIGRQLIEAAMAWGRGRGAELVEIAVHAFNTPAIRAYEQAGFRMSLHRLRRSLSP